MRLQRVKVVELSETRITPPLAIFTGSAKLGIDLVAGRVTIGTILTIAIYDSPLRI
ncbi:hypothetical protein H1R20_g9522, partial [Candolleomyces eurysporus]